MLGNSVRNWGIWPTEPLGGPTFSCRLGDLRFSPDLSQLLRRPYFERLDRQDRPAVGICSTPKSHHPFVALVPRHVGRVSRRNGLPPHLPHPLQNQSAVPLHVLRPSLQRQRQNRRKPRPALPIDTPRRLVIPISTRRLRAINSRPPLHHIQIQFQYSLLPQHKFRHRHQRELRPFPQNRPPRPKNKFFTNCCVIVDPPRSFAPSMSPSAAVSIACQSNP